MDYYNAKADLYKKIAKGVFVLMLLFGMAVVACGVMRISYPDMLSNEDLSTYILVLSLCSTVATAYQTYHNPALRWQQLVSCGEVFLFSLLNLLTFYIFHFFSAPPRLRYTQRFGSSGK